MNSFWLHTALSVIVHTLVLLAIASAGARARYSASRGLRVGLDVIFLFPLLLPLEFTGGSCRNILFIEGWAMLPILYLCAIAGFRGVTREVLDAARLQGMGPCGTFWRFFIPAGRKWLLGGAAVVLIRLALVLGMLIAHSPCAV